MGKKTDPIFFAHSKENSSVENWQSLETHLLKVSEKAKRFAKTFSNEDWVRTAGLLHDLGKYNPDFQTYLKKSNEICEETDEPYETTGKGLKKVDHSTPGALFAVEKSKNAGLILAYLIAGHHTGLPDWYHEKGVGGDLLTRLGKKELLEKIRSHLPKHLLKSDLSSFSTPVVDDSKAFHLWIRMLYSCLVDADFLDTEAFMAPENSDLRGKYDSLEKLLEMFNIHMTKLAEGAKDTPVNRLRKSILDECRQIGRSEDHTIFSDQKRGGIFSLTVPTGGGKTLSAMAFALEHAKKFCKKRIVMAIPFTSIIEQTAAVYKDVFGAQNVIEHHANIDPENVSTQSKLASENWDAPIIVTTNVQLFESLFAARSTRCRKLHNLVNSIIILDEAQTIPAEFLKPILNILEALAKFFNVTLVLCTATQPALCGRLGTLSNGIDGFEKVKEIVSDPAQLTERLKRVELFFPRKIQESVSWEEIASELCGHDRVLCIVNTRKDCRELHGLMPEGTIHLSASMCAEERSRVITDIKEKLIIENSEPVRVISTQLVEAGVDIDFPVVYRALAGLDSIAQAAGRCNREGRMEGKLGTVKVFIPPKPAPPGFLRKGQDTTKELASVGEPDFSPSMITKYFELFYSTLPCFDTKDIHSKLCGNAHEMKIQFRTAARDFKLIDDSHSQSIIVWYNRGKIDSFSLIERLRQKGISRNLLRKLQRFSVNVSNWEFDFYKNQGLVEEVHGIWVQNSHLLYKEGLGVVGQNPIWDDECFII